MKNIEIISLLDCIAELARSDKEFPAHTTFALIRNLNILSPIVEDIYKTRNTILEKYGEKQADSISYIIPEDQREKAMTELQSLDNVEVTVNLVKINLNKLGDVTLTIRQLQGLQPILEEEES